MGGRCSGPEKRRADVLQRGIDADKAKSEGDIKLLLLGAGGSGKSTIFKQMRMLYGIGYSDDERRELSSGILNNLISGTRAVLQAREAFLGQAKAGILEPGGPSAERLSLSDEEGEAIKVVHQAGHIDETYLDEKIAKAIGVLWRAPGFKCVHERRSHFQLFEGYGNFAAQCAEKYPQWGGSDWVPSVEDIMRMRIRTSGMIEERYEIDGTVFRMFDVGGQRNERKKWIHCFDSVTAVIFVGAISEYDQVLFEDGTTNRVWEALELFDEIANSRWFEDTALILFLNKKDVLEQKFVVEKIPLDASGLFPNAPLIGSSIEKVHEFFLATFRARLKSLEKKLYHHITCATDTGNVSTVFGACFDVILRENLAGSSLLE